MRNLRLILSLLLGIFISNEIHSQYFGRNKVSYDDFSFEIYETPNFEIYHYLENEEEIEKFAQLCERWYKRHQAVLLDTLQKRNPLILYNNHADFQQTTVIQSLIGVGTGGVTEGLRKRVVMPLTPSNRDTDHVLGHEMVHVFQYNMLKTDDTLGVGLQSVENVPLWFVEGYSEYLSIGRKDAHTAMWMRDAVKNDNIPTLRQMTREPGNYFPYRFGHAFIAWFTGLYGDAMIRPLFMLSAKWGYERALDSLTGYTDDSLSVLWANSLKDKYNPHLENRQEYTGEKLFDASNAGQMNIAPALSPDGENLVFISDKNVITLDFFLANVKERKITRRITNIIRNPHIDEYRFLESAGTWSPDGKQFALTTFKEGRNSLLVIDMEKGKIVQTIAPEEVNSFKNPDWSPDGETIVLSGLKNGCSNLFLYNLQSGETRQLTNDSYSALQPGWSPDGSKIIFITERGEDTDLDLAVFGNYKMAEYDINTGNTEILNILPGADVINPKYAPGGNEIFFVSNADGHRNIYRYNPGTDEIKKVTDLQTGVIGISSLSPCFDIASDTEELVYILYNNSEYSIYRETLSNLDGPLFSAENIDLTAAHLPPDDRDISTLVVDENLRSHPMTDPEKFRFMPYDPKFTLENIGSSGVGIGTSQFGTGMAGGVSFLFGDILRRNMLMTSLQVQGRVYDIAGQAVYLNQGNRMNWGVTFSHYPYRSAGMDYKLDTINETVVENLIIMEQRVFEDELGFFGQYPLSKKLRFEGGLSGSIYSFRRDSINNYYHGNILLDRESHKVEAPEPFILGRAYLAYVGDGSRFGLTSPMSGYRYRFQIDRTLGDINFWGVRADYRKYYFFPPVGLGFRLMHYGRYGPNADDLYPVFLGNPYYVRGYSYSAMRRSRHSSENFLSIDNLIGSKIAVANAEFRYPFTGPERLAPISSRMFFSDLVLFADGGIIWSDFDNIAAKWQPSKQDDERTPVFSTGIALRINLFGAIILEPYFAIPFQRQPDRLNGTFGFHLSAGGF
ncbi:MAG: BamA/TamA family outer membrane protein [Bacteroidales bacterium]